MQLPMGMFDDYATAENVIFSNPRFLQKIKKYVNED